MNHKEEKFWDALRTYMYGVTAAGPYVEKALTGKGDTGDALASLRQLKRECRNQKEVVMSRMYKAYSKPITLDAAKGFIDRAYTIIDQLTSLLDLLDTIQLGGKPEEVEPLSSLVACSLLEIQKCMEYTTDCQANGPKMEARCRRIYAYEERGDEYIRSSWQYLYRKNQDPMALLYWKDILSHLEKVLDSAAGMADPLWRLALDAE